MKEKLTCTITREIAVISENASGWRLELNEVAWNGAAPKMELRRWSPGHDKSGKGVTLTQAEAVALFEALKKELLK